jgi:hypothetical protein
MDANRKCLVCGGPTEIGFLVDRGHANVRRRQEWWAGEPESSFWPWNGIKKPDRMYKMTTLRCVECGFVMEFANHEGGGS